MAKQCEAAFFCKSVLNILYTSCNWSTMRKPPHSSGAWWKTSCIYFVRDYIGIVRTFQNVFILMDLQEACQQYLINSQKHANSLLSLARRKQLCISENKVGLENPPWNQYACSQFPKNAVFHFLATCILLKPHINFKLNYKIN